MKIRKATVKDFNVIKQLRTDFFLDELQYDKNLDKNWVKRGLPTDTAKGLRSKKQFYAVAEEDNGIIGYASAMIEKAPPFFNIKERGHIFNIYVKKPYRNKGIATKLIKECVKWFKQKSIILYVYHGNATKALYKKLGFKDYLHILQR